MVAQCHARSPCLYYILHIPNIASMLHVKHWMIPTTMTCLHLFPQNITPLNTFEAIAAVVIVIVIVVTMVVVLAALV